MRVCCREGGQGYQRSVELGLQLAALMDIEDKLDRPLADLVDERSAAPRGGRLLALLAGSLVASSVLT